MKPVRRARPPSASTAQVTIRFFVELVSLVGAISFVGAVILGSEVFDHWDLNFLQLATPGDIIGTGISVFGEVFVPIFCMALAGLAAYLFEFRWARWEIVAGTLALLALIGLATFLDWASAANMEETFSRYAEGGAQTLAGQPTQMVLSQASGIVTVAAQAMLTFYVVLLIKKLLAGGDSDPRRRAVRMMAAGGLALSLAYLPWMVLQSRAAELSRTGFLGGMIAPYGCEVGDDLYGTLPTLLWVGDRGAVIECGGPTGVLVRFDSLENVLLGPNSDPVRLDPLTLAPPEPSDETDLEWGQDQDLGTP